MECKKEKVFQFIDEHREEMVNLWQEVVDMKSGPHEKAGIDVVGKRFQSVLNDLGAATRQVEFEQAGNMVIGLKKKRLYFYIGLCYSDDFLFQACIRRRIINNNQFPIIV